MRRAVPIAAPIAERRCRAPFAPLACVFTRSSTAPRPVASDRAIASAPTPESGRHHPGVGRSPAPVRRDARDRPGAGLLRPALRSTRAGGRRHDRARVRHSIRSTPGRTPAAGLADELNRASEGLAVDLPAPVFDDRDQPATVVAARTARAPCRPGRGSASTHPRAARGPGPPPDRRGCPCLDECPDGTGDRSGQCPVSRSLSCGRAMR